MTLEAGTYQPCVVVDDVTAWPAHPLYDQIDPEQARQLQERHIDLEEPWTDWVNPATRTLVRGQDFDVAVLAIPVGTLKTICAEIVQNVPAWQAMVTNVATTQTQAMQLWLSVDLSELGMNLPDWGMASNCAPNTVVYENPIYSWIDMSLVLPYETWPVGHEPKLCVYYTGPLSDALDIPPPGPSAPWFPRQQKARVMAIAEQWLQDNMGWFWPGGTAPEAPAGLDLSLLTDGTDENAPAARKFAAQFFRANVAPWQRFTLAIPGTEASRLKTDASGFSNLFLAGDWIDYGMNVGYIEGAIVSGVQAGNAVLASLGAGQGRALVLPSESRAMTPGRELIAERPRASVYAWSGPEGRLVVKVLHATSPSPRELLSLDNALAVTGALRGVGGFAPALRKERVDGRHALVLQYAAGEELGQWAARIGRAPDRIARAVAAVAQTLGEMHARGVVHKDVKPGHVLYDEATRTATLLDLAIAARVDHASPDAATLDALEGTLAYMSPEQTGRVNRPSTTAPTSTRSARRCYELLTGRPPFDAGDAVQLVHCHIAKRPPAPHALDPRIPPALSDIVVKLLAKSPEDRYESALGLRHDLERCASELEGAGVAPSFPLGARDFSDRLHPRPKLYGREAEIAAMTRRLRAGCAGRVAWVLLAGGPGTGKSALVNELRGPVAARGGVFAPASSSSSSGARRTSAWGARSPRSRARCSPGAEATLAATRDRVRAAVGDRGGALAGHRAEPRAPPRPPARPPALGGLEAQHRLHCVAERASSPRSRPPTDRSSSSSTTCSGRTRRRSRSCSRFVTDREGAHLTLVGAYRPGDVDAEHPLTAMLDATRDAPPVTITVPVLSPADVGALVADALHTTPDEARELAELVALRTEGNPFFVHQLLRTIWEKGALAFDAGTGRWTWSLERVRALGITDNVVQLMSARIRSLPEASQRLVRLAACVGGRFDVATLATVSAQPIAEVAGDAWAAVREGLLVPFGEAYRLAATSESGEAPPAEYSFVHDCVQQAAYALIDDDERRTVHHEIGRLLRARSTGLDGDGVFELVHHLNLAGDRVRDPAERRDLAALNLAAGRRARASAAYVQALLCFRAGIALLPGDAWDSDYELAAPLHAEAADAAYLTGDYDEALRLGRLVVERGRSPIDKVKAFDALVMSAMARDNLAGAIDSGIAALRELGVRFPASPKTPHIILALLRTKLALAGRKTESLVDLPRMTAPDVIAAMRLIERMIPAAFRSGSKLFPLFVFRLVNLSLRHGNMPVSCFGYAAYAITLCGVLGDFEGGYRFGLLSLKLVDVLGAESFRPGVLFIFNNFVRHWKEPLAASLEGLGAATRVGLETGNVFEGVWSCFYRCLWSLETGAELPAVARDLEEHAALFAQDEGAQNLSSLLRQVVHDLATAGSAGTLLAGPHYDASTARDRFATSSDATEVAAFHVLRLELALLFGDPAAAVDHAEQAARYSEAITGLPYVPLLVYLDALARLALHRKTGAPELLRGARKGAKKLRRWAASSPGHHAHRSLLVEAELARADGRPDAHEGYDRAIRAARAAGVLRDEALACELAAAHHAARGNDIVSQALFAHAVTAYRQWGAHAKVKQMVGAEAGGAASGGDAAARARAPGGINLESLMKASSAVTSELVLSRLLGRLIENRHRERRRRDGRPRPRPGRPAHRRGRGLGVDRRDAHRPRAPHHRARRLRGHRALRRAHRRAPRPRGRERRGPLPPPGRHRRPQGPLRPLRANQAPGHPDRHRLPGEQPGGGRLHARPHRGPRPPLVAGRHRPRERPPLRQPRARPRRAGRAHRRPPSLRPRRVPAEPRPRPHRRRAPRRQRRQGDGHPLLRHPRVHVARRGDEARGEHRLHQRVPPDHAARDRPARRLRRQLHRRRHHGALRRRDRPRRRRRRGHAPRARRAERLADGGRQAPHQDRHRRQRGGADARDHRRRQPHQVRRHRRQREPRRARGDAHEGVRRVAAGQRAGTQAAP